MYTNNKESKGLVFGWYSGLFLLFFGVIAFFHIINGSSLIYGVDAFRQDYPVFLYLGKVLRHFLSTGKLHLYDFSIGLGGDVISPLNHNGFNDPLNLLAVFAVGRGAVQLYEFTLILRLYLCGAAMLLFCHKHGKSVDMSVLAAILYAFSAFTVPCGVQFYQMLNAAYIFPLLLIQLEKLIEQKESSGGGVKFSLLIALQACCSFYFLYIQTILMLVYALVEYFIRYPKDVKGIWGKIICVFKYYLYGILLSGVVLFPVLGGFFQSVRVGNGIVSELHLFWTVEEILLKLQNMFIHKRSAMFAVSLGIPFVSFLAIMKCWFGRNKKECILSVLLTIAYASPVVGSMMNGFSYPNHRWVYAIYFGIAYATVLLIEHCEEKIGEKKIIAATAVFIFSMCYHYYVERDKIRTAVIILLMAVCVWCLLSNKEKRRRNLTRLLFVNVLLNLIFLEGPYQICGQELYLSFKPRTEMGALAETVKAVKPANEWYRIDRPETANQGALLQGYQGCWAYYSIMNGNIWKFYDALKISPAMQSINYLAGLDGRQVPASLLNVRYWEKNGELEENRYALPFGVEYETTFDEETFWKLSPLERQDVMTRSIVLEKREDTSDGEQAAVDGAVIPLEWEAEYLNITEENGRLVAGENAEIIVHIKEDIPEPAGGELYLYLEGIEEYSSGGEGSMQVAGKSLAIDNAENIYATGQRDQLVKIDEYSRDISVKLAANSVHSLERMSVYWYDLAGPREALEVLGKHSFTNLQYTDDCFEGEIDADGGYLFLSIPYDKAWKVYVDQTEVPTERANIGFTAVKLAGGTHHIKISYEPLLQKVGLAAAFLGILFTAADWVMSKKRRQFMAAAGKGND